MPIRYLSSIDTLQVGDQLAIGSMSNGDDRKAALSLLLDWTRDNLDLDYQPSFSVQYAAPSATGFTVQITDSSASTHLILTPVAGYAAGTITLPTSSNCADQQEILINCTQAVTTLTVGGNGATVAGAPTTLAANAYFRLKYDLPGTTWYRVG
jgi:hypothetical protein